MSLTVADEHEVRIVAAGLMGWDVSFCPVCDDMLINSPGNPGLSDHCRRKGDPDHLALEVMQS